MKKIISHKVLLLLILVTGAFFRFYGVNWDQGHHLHPDERFLTMVTTAMQLPGTFQEYLNPETSTLNPANLNFTFFVYGILPLILTKIVALVFNLNTYEAIPHIGRVISAICDIFVVFLIYKISFLFEKRLSLSPAVKFLAAFFYAIAVLPIQLSHFYTVDTFLNFFLLFSFYLACLYYTTKKTFFLIPSAAFFGFAVATKVSAVYFLPLIIFFIFPTLTSSFVAGNKLNLSKFSKAHVRLLATVFGVFLLYGFISYSAVRLTDPYLFQHNNFLNPEPSKLFLTNLKTLQSLTTREIGFPPQVQWISKTPVLYSLKNLALFGMGIPLVLLMVVGLSQFLRTKKIFSLAVSFWCIGFFFYQAMQITQTMRYFLILYPFFSIFAAVGFCTLTNKRHLLLKVIILLIVLIWPLLFFSIYTKPHSRVTASEWIYQHIPPDELLLAEHWDDALPLPMERYSGISYKVEQLPVFDHDTDTKWSTMNNLLASSNYLILSSNRGWGSITTVPDKYPRMSKFYDDLFNGKLAYKKIAEFTSYPSLTYLGIPITIPDDTAEEAFTVYDHPKVMIFKKGY